MKTYVCLATNPQSQRQAGWGPVLAAAVGMLLFGGILPACGGDAPAQPTPGAGGSSGQTGNGGSGASTGTGGNTGSSGGAGGSSSGGGEASVRFCNGVSGANGAVTVEVEIAGKKAQAASGTCASGCMMIPAGSARVVFRMNNGEVFGQDVGFEAGQHYGVVATLDNTTQKVGLGGGKLPAGQQCSTYNPFGGGSGDKAVGKFCHSLAMMQGVPLQLELVVGDVRLTAMTGSCSSPSMQMCPSLPSGNVTAQLLYNGMMVTSKQLNLEAGRAYLFSLGLDTAGQPLINSEALASAMACTTAVPMGGTTMMPPPPPPGSKTTVKFCNRMVASAGAPNLADVVTQDGVKFSARPGQCAPAKGVECSKVNAGPNVLTLSLDGTEVGNASGNFPADREVTITLAPATTGDPSFTIRTVPAGMMCSAYEPM